MSQFNFYDFNLTAGGSQYLPVVGSYFRIISATGDVSVQQDNGATGGPFQPGRGLKNQNFQALTIFDKSGAANKGVIMVAGADFVDDRITGEVSVIDGGKSRTLSGVAYTFGFSAGAHVGGPPFAILYNPAGSGKNLIVKTCSFSANTAGTYTLDWRNTNTEGTDAPSSLIPKNFGQPASSAKAYLSNGAAAGAGDWPVSQVAAVLAANQVNNVIFQEPHVVRPGFGLRIRGYNNNVQLLGQMEYIEDLA